MFKKLNIQMIRVSVLIAAALLVSLSAFRFPASMSSSKALIPVSSNEAGLTQYHRSEWKSFAVVENSLGIYHQSERVQAYPAKSNEVGLAQYHKSEMESGVVIQNGLEKYHQSEWHGQ